MKCTHPIKLHDLCSVCGEITQTTSDLHFDGTIKISRFESKRIQKKHKQYLMENKKLILIIDLDQTLLHSKIIGKEEYGVDYFNILQNNNNDFNEDCEENNVFNMLEDNIGLVNNRQIDDNSKNANYIDDNINDSYIDTYKDDKSNVDLNSYPRVNYKYPPVNNGLTKLQMNNLSKNQNKIESRQTTLTNASTDTGECNYACINKVIKENNFCINNKTPNGSYSKKPPTTFSFTLSNALFIVKLRPGIFKFLSLMNKYFELYIYTLGTREYALEILKRFDGDGKYFGERKTKTQEREIENSNAHDNKHKDSDIFKDNITYRVITRDESGLVKSLNRIVTGNRRNTLILDDRIDVWKEFKNVILIRPFYHFDTGDINDPTLLSKDYLNKGINIGIQTDLNSNLNNDFKKDIKCDINNDHFKEDHDDDKNNHSKKDIENTFADDIKNDLHIKRPYVEDKSSKRTKIRNSSENKNLNAKENVTDNELKKISKFLIKMHHKYFKSKSRDITHIYDKYKKRIFKNIKIFTDDPEIERIFKVYGGSVVKDIKDVHYAELFVISYYEREYLEKIKNDVNSVILDPYLKNNKLMSIMCICKENSLNLIDSVWVLECIYQMKLVDMKGYLLADFHDEYVQDIEKSLEDEIFE